MIQESVCFEKPKDPLNIQMLFIQNKNSHKRLDSLTTVLSFQWKSLHGKTVLILRQGPVYLEHNSIYNEIN